MIAGKYLVKVCGMTDGNNIREVEEAGADIIGFIFCDGSPRRISRVPSYLPEHAACAGVFMDEPVERIIELRDAFHLDYIQLHGLESPEYCSALVRQGIPRSSIIKVFHVRPDADEFPSTSAYDNVCGNFLFDTVLSKHTGVSGGTGKSFDWNALDCYGGPLPFLLSGGISLDSCAPAQDRPSLAEFRHPYLAGYDLNSRFETTPGIKNAQDISLFIKKLNELL